MLCMCITCTNTVTCIPVCTTITLYYVQAGQSSPGDKSKIGELSGNKGSDVLATPPGGERRSRRKPKIEPLVIHEMEEEGVCVCVCVCAPRVCVCVCVCVCVYCICTLSQNLPLPSLP